MDQKPPTLESTQIKGEIGRLNAICQQLSTNEVISPTLGGEASIKTTISDVYGQRVEALLLLSASEANPLLARSSSLRNLAAAAPLPESEFKRELQASMLTAESSMPNDSALLHASLQFPAIIRLTHPSILAVGCHRDWEQRVQAIFGDQTAAVEYTESNFALRAVILKAARDVKMQAIFIRYVGLLIGADNLNQAAQAAIELFAKVAQNPLDDLPAFLLEPAVRVGLAERRQELSRSLGSYQLLRQVGDLPASINPALFNAAGEPTEIHARSFHHLAADSTYGLLVYGSSGAELEYQSKLLLSDLKIRMTMTEDDPCQLLPVEAMPISQPAAVFSGEIALVTGAATGIGRAAVHSLLKRGAAVAAMDIKPEITSLFDSPAYLGFQVDLTDEKATLKCLEQMVRKFGGLDMLVLNAGIFPASCNLENLSMEEWRKVMQINVDVNITLLRECFPLLKRAPRYGRVVINASRNVPAPGPGAAAYSASKAALTQLGRVAALEWASSGIRVNMLNPHAVFDTGIWTDEVLHSRAAKYGLTVEQYKTNNLLHVELTSHDLGELIAETLGPIFSKTTGAQIPVDGGSDRVI